MNHQIEFRHLLYFKTLAEELHFRKAAERLYISQPGLSRQIKQMEEIYGAALFNRNQRAVALTAAGKYLKDEVEVLFNHLQKIENQIQNIGNNDFTELKLGFIGSAVQAILPKLLLKLNHHYPQIDVTINELANEVQLDMIAKHELDFGFVRVESAPANLNLKPILTEHFSLVVPKDHPIQTHNFTSLAAFKDENFILFSKAYSSSYYNLVMSIFEDHHFKPNVTLKTVNALSIFHLVAQGLGVAIVPTSLKKGYDAEVQFIELKEIPQKTTLYLAWNSQNKNSGVPIFLDIVEKEIFAHQSK